MSSEGIPLYKSMRLLSSDDGKLSLTKQKKMEDLTAIVKQKPQLYIMNTLANISIISSEKDLGTDAYLQPLFNDIDVGMEWCVNLGMIMVMVHRKLAGSHHFVHNMMNSYICQVIVHVNPLDTTMAEHCIVISKLAVVSDNGCNGLLSF